MKKLIYSLSALMMACIISFSGIGGSYIQARASNIVTDALWNEDESAWRNIIQYVTVFMSVSGAFAEPTLVGDLLAIDMVNNFFQFMLDDGYSQDVAHDVLCDCGDSTHTSFSGNEHGGGGFVRDGVSRDEDGNVTYSDEVSDLFHGYIVQFLDSECGYLWIKTKTPNDLNVNAFPSSESYYGTCDLINDVELINIHKYGDISMVGGVEVNIICNDITYDYDDYYLVYYNNTYCYLYSKETWQYLSSFSHKGYLYNTQSSQFDFKKNHSDTFLKYENFYSNDGRYIKIFKSTEAFKMYEVGNQPYYVTDSFNSYNSADNNSITITNSEYQYYTDNSNTIYETIQNNITNYGGDLDEKTVQDIVEDAVKEIKDSIANSGNSGGNGSGDSDNDNGGGTGISAIIEGIGKLFDTILTLIGKLMGVVADFTTSILDLFSGFTTFTDGFSGFLSGAFSFIPAEIWNVIQVGLSLMILLAVIKFLRK